MKDVKISYTCSYLNANLHANNSKVNHFPYKDLKFRYSQTHLAIRLIIFHRIFEMHVKTSQNRLQIIRD